MLFPENGLPQKIRTLRLWISGLKIPVYSANACYFILLAVLPALLLLMELLRLTSLDVAFVSQFLSGILPDAIRLAAQDLIRHTYGWSSSAVVGISALTALWSASRGLYGILTGLNVIYGAEESRGYIRTRLLSTVYMLVFLAVLLLTLGLQVFMGSLLSLLFRLSPPVVQFLLKLVDFRFFLLLFLQVLVFTLMFMVLPNAGNTFRDSLPGALFAACGWLIFSHLFSFYVEYISSADRIYGPLSTLVLGMLWLYFCVCIVFYGAALNVLLKKDG